MSGRGLSAPVRRAIRPAADASQAVRGRVHWLPRVVLGVLLVAGLIVGGTAFRVWQVARVDDGRPVDVVVVLGAAQYDGSPSPIFASRLRHAQWLFERGMAASIVTVGGRRAGDGFTEADAGRRYLVDRGVPGTAVTSVGEGSDTLGSLRAAARVAGSRGWRSALLVSDPWHSLRARTMARDAGLLSWTSPTRSGPVVQTRETQARYIVRETGALLFYRLTHASVETESSGLG
ncbi:MAG: YdcF family protein [Pseudonocardia sp.]|nr:YdcF family protein [Pseudonocardia sp.]